MSSIFTDLPRVSPDPLPTATATAQPNQFYDDMMPYLGRGDLAVDEYEEDFMSTVDADEHFEGLPPSSERDDAELISDDNDLMSLIEGNLGEEYYFMSTGARDDNELFYDGMMSLIRGDFAEEDFMFTGYEEDSMATPQSNEGLPEEVIATFLKTMTACDGKPAAAGGGGVCAVCLDDLYEEDRAVGVLGCRHGFHGDCIGNWLRKKNDCPLCRAIAVKL